MWKRMKSLTPILSAIAVAACTISALSGYTKPVYAVDVPDPIITDTADSDGNSEEPAENKDSQEALNTKQEEELTAGQAGAFDLADGTYEGSGVGYAGRIRVTVTLKDKTITAIDITENEADTASFFDRAKGVIPQIISTQSLNVDTVSGATYSSRGIINAVKNALTKENDTSAPAASASKTADTGTAPSIKTVTETGTYRDGTYYGTGSGFAGTGSIQVKVVIQNGKIASAQVTESRDTQSYLNQAKALLNKIVSGQTTNVDAVSGATYSSAGIIEAVRNALSQAQTGTSNSSTDNTGANNGTDTKADQNTQSDQTKQDNSENSSSDESDKTGHFPYSDGTYEGVGEGYSDLVRLQVVIENQTLKSITVLETYDDEAFFGRAERMLDTMIQTQSIEVDTVSGATFSSEGILEAMKAAVESAKAQVEHSEADQAGSDHQAGSQTESSKEEIIAEPIKETVEEAMKNQEKAGTS